ncbi:MAG TPA: WHG domain-containing protein [Candidatus Limnocylindrales bacterium]|nr:WHG domain-containing protein [Candidatus Limnocylindrales bacterium]
MPTPARTSTEAIVAAGRRILELEGLAGLTMQRVAADVGVRPPSLYKRVRGRGELIRLIANDLLRELEAAVDTAAASGDPRRDLAAIARAFRSFARAHPEGYSMVFGRLPTEWQPDLELTRRSSATLIRTVTALAGPHEGLEAARTVTAWANGFIGMELAGAFRLGGDVDRAFDYGIARLTEAIARDRS